MTKTSFYYNTVWNDRVAPSFQSFQETNYIQSLQVDPNPQNQCAIQHGGHPGTESPVKFPDFITKHVSHAWDDFYS